MIPNYTIIDENDIIEHHPGKSTGLAKDILMLFEGMPVEDMKTAMSGMTIALISIIMRAKRKYIVTSEPDGIERMILRWMANMDPITNLHFSPYIKLPER